MSPQIPSLSACLEHEDRRKVIVCKELGKEYRALNDAEQAVCKYSIDNKECLVFGARKTKCDFLVSVSQCVLFIELKGGNIDHAAQQILDTAEKLGNDLQGRVLFARIVSSHVPKIAGPSLSQLYRKFRRERVALKTTRFEESLDSLSGS